MTTKQRSILEYVGFRVEIETTQGEKLIGKLLAYDKFGNVVMSDVEQFRISKKRKTNNEIVEPLGMMFLRGEMIQLIKVERSLTRSRNVVDRRIAPAESRVVLDASKLLKAPAKGISLSK